MKFLMISASALALVACTPAAETKAPGASAAPETTAVETTPAEAVELGSAGTYTADPWHTSVTWRVDHLGLSNYTARFNTVAATLVFERLPADWPVDEAETDPMSTESVTLRSVTVQVPLEVFA